MNINIWDRVIDLVKSDLPIGTRTELVRHYLLPTVGAHRAIVELDKPDVGAVDRPNAEDIKIENNPRLKAEYKDTERLMK